MLPYYMKHFFNEDGTPICISAKFSKPLLPLQKHMKLTINMHDLINKKRIKNSEEFSVARTRQYKDTTSDWEIRNTPTQIKYTIATTPVNGVVFDSKHYKSMESIFFTQENLTVSAKRKLRKTMNDINHANIEYYENQIYENEQYLKLFYRLYNGIKNKNTYIMAQDENTMELFANPPTLTLYEEFFANSEFLDYIQFTEIYNKKSFDETTPINEIRTEMKIVKSLYEKLKKKSDILQIPVCKSIVQDIEDYEKKVEASNTIENTEYTFKTVDDKECMHDVLMTYVSGSNKKDTDEFIYHYGFDAVPFCTDTVEKMRFIDFFRDFVKAKKLTQKEQFGQQDVDTYSYTNILLMYELEMTKLGEDTKQNPYKKLVKLLMNTYDKTTSYALNIEKRPDCVFGTFIYEYIKELIIAKYLATREKHLLRLFYEIFSIDHPGNRPTQTIYYDPMFDDYDEPRETPTYEGYFYNSTEALDRRFIETGYTFNNKYIVNKADVMEIFCNICDKLDILDNGCKFNEELEICEKGYFATPRGSSTRSLSSSSSPSSMNKTRKNKSPK